MTGSRPASVFERGEPPAGRRALPLRRRQSKMNHLILGACQCAASRECKKWAKAGPLLGPAGFQEHKSRGPEVRRLKEGLDDSDLGLPSGFEGGSEARDVRAPAGVKKRLEVLRLSVSREVDIGLS
jgi:hypothetical protein